MGSYAAQLKQRLRGFANVQVFGEVWNLGGSKAKVYFELRDERGALPCSMWRTDFEKLKLDRETLADGAQIVVGGGTDYYEGSRTSSPPSRSWCASYAWQARATCWPSWLGFGRNWTPRACSTCRSGCRGRGCRAPSAWSPARPARRVTT